MGVMKRIATERQWNENLAGGTTDSEMAAMRRIYCSQLDERFGKDEPREAVKPPTRDYQGELPF